MFNLGVDSDVMPTLSTCYYSEKTLALGLVPKAIKPLIYVTVTGSRLLWITDKVLSPLPVELRRVLGSSSQSGVKFGATRK